MDKLKISAIYKKDGTTPKESHQFRVGREGIINFLEHDKSMIFFYADRQSMMVTSPVESFQEDDCGVLVTTENSVYRFDRVDIGSVKDD